MKRTGMFWMVVAATVACGGVASAQNAHEMSPVANAAVLAQNLKKLESTGKVKAALWTLRNDSCTLQLVLPWELGGRPVIDPTAAQPIVLTGRTLAGPLPAVKVWLLTASGSQISPTTVVRPDPSKYTLRTIAADYSFSFPRWVNGQAVAAAIQIGDDFYIEALQELADRPL